MAAELHSAGLSTNLPSIEGETSHQRSERAEYRSVLALPLVVCGLNVSGRIFFEMTSTHDVSGAGCRIHLCTQPQFESPLAIRMIKNKGSASEESIQILFQLAWLQPEGDGWAVGAQRLGDADLRALVFQSHTP